MKIPFSVASAAAVLLGSAIVLSGCAAPSGTTPEPAGSATAEAAPTTRVVATDQGDVTIPTDPQRVVLLNYALAGYLYDLDVPVAAMIAESTTSDAVFSDFWKDDAEAAETTFVPWSNEGFDLQAILALEPDLIVAGGLGFPLMLATKGYDQLSEIAPTVIVSGEATEWQDQYEFLAVDVFDRPEVFAEAEAAYADKVADVRDAITVPAGDSAFVSFTADQRPFVLIEDRGLPAMFTELGFTPAPLFAGGQYEAYTQGGDSFELSSEQAGQVLTQDSLFVFGFNAETIDIPTLQASPIYSTLPAFQDDQVFQFPYWAQRADFDETMAVLDLVDETFGK